MADELVYEERGAAAWLRLNRPDARNAIDRELLRQLDDGLARAQDSATARVVVISGTGRAFCAGADLNYVRGLAANGAKDAMLGFLTDVGEVFARIESLPLPVIAAVNGVAVAGGLELVLCCDLVLAATTARLGDGHAGYGLLPGGGSTVRLPRRIGSARAKHLLFTGSLVPAAELVDCGLVNQVTYPEELEAATNELVASIAEKSPLGVARMKQLVNDGLEQPKDVALRAELLASELHQGSHDVQEGLAAFAERRVPKFRGH